MRNDARQSITTEHRWGVVDASEPPDIRLVLGFVTVLEHQTPVDGAFLTYKILFFDAVGRPLTAFPSENFQLFASAAALAMAELEEDAADELENGPEPIAVLVPLALPEELNG